jgi:hypothetical protein
MMDGWLGFGFIAWLLARGEQEGTTTGCQECCLLAWERVLCCPVSVPVAMCQLALTPFFERKNH